MLTPLNILNSHIGRPKVSRLRYLQLPIVSHVILRQQDIIPYLCSLLCHPFSYALD